MRQGFVGLFMVAGLCANAPGFARDTGFVEKELSAQERQWLERHPRIRLAPDPDFAPFEFFDEKGAYRGMAADYVRLLEAKLGVRFEIVRLENWGQALEQARVRGIDMFGAAARTPRRERYMRFTSPHIVVPGVILTAGDAPGTPGLTLEKLRQKKVAVVRGYVWHDLIRHRYPDIRLLVVPDIVSGLGAASLGLADAMVGDLATTSYAIRQQAITNLRVGGRLEQKLELALATRRDWPELNLILEKALAAIRPAEHEAIRARWIRLEQPSLLQSRGFWLVVAAVLGSLLAVIGAVGVWNRMLRIQVQRRTRELQAAQMRLIEAAKLESVGRLAAGVAHEVKNPLAVMQMGIDYLRNDIKEEAGAEVIRDMEDAVNRADTVIRDLLDFSRRPGQSGEGPKEARGRDSTAGKKLRMRRADLNEVIRRSLHLVRHELVNRNITLVEALDEGLPPFPMDAGKLQQVFINLFVNAAQAMGRDGRLGVRSYAARVGELVRAGKGVSDRFKPGDRVLVVEVEDTGPGIEESKVGRVFDPFFTTKPVGQGTGLGLSVSRTIVELHRGSIALGNRPGGGASAVIVFKFQNGETTDEKENTGSG